MKLDSLLDQSFSGTTVDIESLKKFLCDKPNYLGWGIDLDLRKGSLNILNSADYVEFHLRMYLLGEPKTLYRVFREIRFFINMDHNAAHHFITYSMEVLKQEILSHEWYELMPRMDYAIKKIQPLIPNRKSSLEPLLLHIIREFYPGHAQTR
ncbi:hypothetical protein [Spirosoma pollinicola]|uniref:Uncharacterized protein n=1 Tax=Spirosoma pollinicola TaxID=2057025 RepID=A0A2K8ZAW3_9BACT|nr:hypothetical protein [Spirosoma pollinicola]AUD07021.1 hypothetical protein CWM47_37490 [Spirosoma pollinicola]